MSTVKRKRAIIWLLGLFISGIVVVVPPVYFYISYSYIAGNLASEAEINAYIISQSISRNPEMWEFEHVRIEEYLSRRPMGGDSETRRVFNIKNDIIAQSVNELARPILTKSSVLRDSGVEVGRIEISRSLRHLMEQTGLAALVITLLGLSMYLILRALLLHSLNRAQNLVEQNEARYRAVVEDLPMLLCRFLSDGTVSFVNKAYCRYFGKTIEEVLGHSFQLPALKEEQRFVPSQLGFLTTDNPTETYELRVIAGNGETRWQRWIVRAIFQEGRQVEFQSIGEDITERKQAEEERLQEEQRLRQAQKVESLGRMAGAIAHHFNNMLGAVMGNLELALCEVPQWSELEENITEALKASRRAAEISRFMLAYLGQTTGKKEAIDLTEAVRDTYTLLNTSLPKNVKLKTDFQPQRPIIRADGVQMKQVFTNLLLNAIEAIGKEEGSITLATRVMEAKEIREARLFPLDWEPKSESYACLSVSDTGCGLDAVNQEKIFDPFFSTKFTGRGLGLSVALGLVRTHEGAISIESKPGQGTTFKVFLPLLTQQELCSHENEAPCLWSH